MRPHEEKLCFSAVFEMNEKAEILGGMVWPNRDQIRQAIHLPRSTEVIDTGEGDMKHEILKLNELAVSCVKTGLKHGSIAFERDEVKIDVDEKGNPVRIYAREHDHFQ